MSGEPALDMALRLAPVCLAAYAAALAFLPGLRWRPRARGVAGLLLSAGLLLAPLALGAERPLDRAITAVITGTFVIKMYDVYRGASMGSLPTLRRYMLFLVIPFCHVYRRWDDAPLQTRSQCLRHLARGAVLGAAATAALLLVSFDALGRTSFLLEHAARVTLIFAACAGWASVVFALYCLAGGRGWPMFENFFAARTPAEFWRLYNRTVTQYLFENVFRQAGGARTPFRATMAAFLVSGVLHEYIADIAVGGVQGLQMAFFTVQGLAVAATQRLRPRGAAAAAGFAATAAFMLVTSLLFTASAARIFQLYSPNAPAWIQPRQGVQQE